MIRVVSSIIVELFRTTGLFLTLLVLNLVLGDRVNFLLFQVRGHFEITLTKEILVLLYVKWVVDQFDFQFQIWVFGPEERHCEAPLGIPDLKSAGLLVETVC